MEEHQNLTKIYLWSSTGNGDILSFEDANLYKEASGVQGIMIAR